MTVTDNFFKKLNIYTIIAVYFLILVGGIVRSTGSGMGCPDWPKCFGSVIPPTSETQLPSDYKAHYLELRLKKNERIAKMVSAVGFSDLALEITNDPSILVEEPFNITKTWIEYLNRLVGVAIGLLIFGVLVTSFIRRKTNLAMFYWSLFAFILVAFQGWFGSIVVSTNLLPGTITIHMALALVLVAVLIFMVFKIQRDNKELVKRGLKNINLLTNLMVLAISFFLVQIFLGTQVRESVDLIANSIVNRGDWINNLGLSFLIHRTYSLLIFGLQVWIARILYVNKSSNLLMGQLFYGMVGLIVLEIISGAIMAYFSIPAVLQPLHLLIATLIFGVQFYTYLYLRHLKTISHILA